MGVGGYDMNGVCGPVHMLWRKGLWEFGDGVGSIYLRYERGVLRMSEVGKSKKGGGGGGGEVGGEVWCNFARELTPTPHPPSSKKTKYDKS